MDSRRRLGSLAEPRVGWGMESDRDILGLGPGEGSE